VKRLSIIFVLLLSVSQVMLGKGSVTLDGEAVSLLPWKVMDGEISVCKVEFNRTAVLRVEGVPGAPDTTLLLDRPSFHILGSLHVFADHPMEKPSGECIYFGPGEHVLEGDSLRLFSGQTLYLHKDAILKGFVCIDDASSVRVLVHGTIDPGCHEGIMVRRSSDILVDGPFTTQIPVGESRRVTVRDTKVISYYPWGDGYNVFASQDVSYEHVFARTSDDCTTIYCTRKGYSGSCRNISFRDAVLKADIAHPIMIGLHGNPDACEAIRDVLYEDILILGQNESQVDYMGCMAINDGDNVLVDGVTFRMIDIRDVEKGMLLNFRVCFNRKYCSAPGRGIRNVTLEDVSCSGGAPALSIVSGYDEERTVEGVHFVNLSIDGRTISDDMPERKPWWKTSDLAGVFIGEHCKDITFTKR